ncbi:MAG TPA: aldehyde dehydrogenase family protein [Gaiellaceae bacterium]|nr:aldehyde dehydrogenase family protein [Gaiellaceae bacterium]
MAVVSREEGVLIGGRWSSGDGEGFEVVNPATEEPFARLHGAGPAAVANAIAAARTAQPRWAALAPVERSAYLRALGDLLERHKEPLARTLVEEVGKPISRARGEIDWAIGYVRYTAEWDRRIEGDIVPSDNRNEAIHLMRAPLGVVAAICAWNYPLAILIRKIAPALVTGNTVVAKASEVTPLSTIELARRMDDEIGLPEGVFNLLTGGSDVGSLLVESPEIDMITFTGHRDTGKRIMAAAAPNLTQVALELGGKAPVIVLRDADLEETVAAVVSARHENTGQVCTCAERVFVEAPVFDEFVARYTTAAAAVTVGQPGDDPEMGPLVNAAQFDKVTSAVRAAVGAGATVATGGGRPDGAEFERGYWFAPTVVVDVQPEMKVMREEVFGPVTPIMSVDSLDHALELANSSRYGLSAYLFTNDYRAAMRAAQDFESGEIYINRANGEQFQAHHIGHGDSGVGGEDGKYGVLKYTQLKSVYHRFG